VVALVIAFFQERDDRWERLAIDQLGISRSVLEQYLAHGDRVFLANFVCVTQKIFLYHSENGDWPLFHDASLRTLEMASRFDARHTLPELQHEFCSLWNRLVRTARNDNDPHTRSTAVRMLKQIRNTYVALHEGIDTTGSTLPKFRNDDPALDQASSYPLCDTHNHISTLTALPSPDVTAKPTKDTTHTPVISPVLLQASESTLSPSTPPTVSQSPRATAVPLGSPLIQPPIFPTPVPAPAAHKLPSPSHPAPTPSGMHHTGQHTSSDTATVPSGSAHFGSVSVYPTATSSIPAPQKTSISAHVMTARSTDLPIPAEAMSGEDQPKLSGSQ
jgi:hypothetical protein